MQVLVLLDGIQFPLLKEGEPPIFNYSHDKNVFQFAHEALRQGHDVYMTAAQEPHDSRTNFEVFSAYPVWRSGRQRTTAELAPDIVISVFPDALNVRDTFPSAKIVSIIPALHWVEDPGLFDADYMLRMISAARYHIDYFVTQNSRMKQILYFMVHLLAKFPYEDRILVAPQGIVPEVRRSVPDRAKLRTELGLNDDNIMIINSGGIWKWTDFCTFFEAYVAFTKERPEHRFRLYVMGITQEFNHDHKEYTDRFRALLSEHREKLGDKLVMFEDWAEAGKLVQAYTSIADLGLNVSQDTLEAWQSYRMRFLDYLYFGFPAINTRGDDLSVRHPEVVFPVTPGDVETYIDVLRRIDAAPELLEQKRAAVRDLAKAYDSRETYGKLVERLQKLPRRAVGDYQAWSPSLIDAVPNDINLMPLSQFVSLPLPPSSRKLLPRWIPGPFRRGRKSQQVLSNWRRGFVARLEHAFRTLQQQGAQANNLAESNCTQNSLIVQQLAEMTAELSGIRRKLQPPDEVPSASREKNGI